MYRINDSPPQVALMFYVFLAGTIVASFVAAWRPWHQPWPLERTCWFFGTALYSIIAFSVGTDAPRRVPNAGDCGILIWAVAVLAYFAGLFQKPSVDPRLACTKFADLSLSVVCLVIFTATILPSVAASSMAANTASCKNNLRQIMLAHWNQYDVQSRFSAASEGDPPYSWRVALLPWLNQQPVFDRYQFGATWDSTQNLPVTTTRMNVFQCPSRKEYVGRSGLHDTQNRYFSHYARVTGLHTAGSAISVREITDGTSNTVMVVEACGVDRVWTNPVDVNIDSQPIGINLSSDTQFQSSGWISSHHTGGAHIAMADGSVRFVNEKIDPKLLKALVTTDGGEHVGNF